MTDWKFSLKYYQYFTMIVVLYILSTLFLGLVWCGSVDPPQPVTKIPNYPGKIEGQYSGYVTTDEKTGRSLYYLFVKSTNESAPVILWIQGGPGCSGLMAYLTEHGPYTLLDDGSVVKNPWSLNELGHVIYLDSPAGIGYSICEDQKAYISGNDSRTADDVFKFLEVFFTDLFPEYHTHDFFMFGESYAGIYCPWIAKKIYDESKNMNGFKVNLRGIMMSNAVINMHNERNSRPHWMFYHGILSLQQYHEGKKACDDDFWVNRFSPNCSRWLKKCNEKYMRGINILDLYGECYGGYGPQTGGENDASVNCLNTNASSVYFNSREALIDFHVDIDRFVKYTGTWEMCRSDLQLFDNYTTNKYDVTGMIQSLLEEVHPGIRIFMISGDADNCVTTLANQWSMMQFLPDEALEQWDSWLYKSLDLNNQQVGGKYRVWKNFAFATIRGSGHMISEYKPYQSFVLYSRFLENSFPN